MITSPVDFVEESVVQSSDFETHFDMKYLLGWLHRLNINEKLELLRQQHSNDKDLGHVLEEFFHLMNPNDHRVIMNIVESNKDQSILFVNEEVILEDIEMGSIKPSPLISPKTSPQQSSATTTKMKIPVTKRRSGL